MKRKLNATDECSRGTTTTAGLTTFASQDSPGHLAQESRCQVAFCEQTAREMTELVDYWQAVHSAQKERSPIPTAPLGNSLFAWSDDEDESTISFDGNVQRQLFPEDDDEEEEDVETHELIQSPLHKASDALIRNEDESLGARKSPNARNLLSDFSSASLPSTPTSQDETSSLPSEIRLCGLESPDWIDSNAEKRIVQNIHIISQQQSMQVEQLTRRTEEFEQQVHTTLMNSPLFQRYNRRSPFKKQRQDVLQAIDVALDQQSSSPIISSSPKCWQDCCDVWLRYGWHRFEDTLHLGLWEWVPFEWLTIYYYLWARPSAQTRWTILIFLGLMTMLLLRNFRFGSNMSTGNLVHFSGECISATAFPEKNHIPELQSWLL